MKIIKIGSTWCSGCTVMKPIWKKVDETIKYEYEYYDYDIYEDELKEKYNIKDKLPITIFLDKNNNIIEYLDGELKYENIINLINKYKEL